MIKKQILQIMKYSLLKEIMPKSLDIARMCRDILGETEFQKNMKFQTLM